jgi:hypothetical protein
MTDPPKEKVEPRPMRTSTEPVATFDVLLREHDSIWGEDPAVENPDAYCRKVNGKGQAALCLSGGGIRSAAFALGLVQALSRARLLTGFHYLSTVSGGGYLGAWLQRWIYEEGRCDPRTGIAAVGREAAAGIVMDKLGAPEQPDEIRHLRQNSSFITPKVGLGSNDTWTAIAISVRNIVVNWLLFAPLLMLVALLPNLLQRGIASIIGAAQLHLEFLYGLLGLTAFCIAAATAAMALLLPSYRCPETRADAEPGEGDRLLNRRIVAWLIAWAVFATLALAVELFDPASRKTAQIPYFFPNGFDVALASLAGMLAGLMAGAARLKGDYAKTFDRDYVIWPVAIGITAAWVALGALLLSWYFPRGNPEWAAVLLAVLGPLWILTATLVGAIAFAAFRQSEGPTILPDDDREWLARLSAVKLRPMLLWAVLAPSVLLLNRLGGDVNHASLSLPSLVTVAAAIVAVFGGRSSLTGATARQVGAKALKYAPLSTIIGVATLLFVVALLMLFGRLELMLAAWLPKQIGWAGNSWVDGMVAMHVAIMAGCGILLWCFGRLIPVNRFSLNGLYRNRLARAFLGAARGQRDPDLFTGFDAADNIRLHKLATGAAERNLLYPVINASLNVTATENLAWQERKAEPFVFTPHYCGSGALSRAPKSPSRRTGAFVETSLYAGREPDFGMHEKEVSLGASTPLGVTLATATALSGAAASPNMGYYSSPATAFLMTLFNVRLGAWLPNPARAHYLKTGISRSSPKNSMGPIISELKGSTHDRGDDIYLSDGGHFENLGLYEMIRRRCRYMVVSDAAADPHCAMKDLGNAVRKVKIDFDVDIQFTQLHISSRDQPLEPKPQFGWALGKVRYPDDGCEGDVLYLKPSYFGEGIPVDVIAYARGSTGFPHESTANQFFSESQFESYRRLADHVLDQLLNDVRARRIKPGKRRDALSLEHLFDELEKINAELVAAEKHP